VFLLFLTAGYQLKRGLVLVQKIVMALACSRENGRIVIKKKNSLKQFHQRLIPLQMGFSVLN
jgi:hypothetical protein